MTTGAGKALPLETVVTTEATISVVARLSLPPDPPDRYSSTTPSTLTASPTAAVGAVRV